MDVSSPLLLRNLGFTFDLAQKKKINYIFKNSFTS